MSRPWPGPQISRAMCGATRPTKPTIPPAATAAAVARLAPATTASRAQPSGSPRLRAVSSPEAIASSGRASSHTAVSPISSGGAATAKCPQLRPA